MKVISQSSDARSKQQQHQPVSAPDMPQHQLAPVHVLATFWCHPWKSLGQMSNMVEQSKVDYADNASPKAKGSTKRRKVKKPGTEKAGRGDLGHQKSKSYHPNSANPSFSPEGSLHIAVALELRVPPGVSGCSALHHQARFSAAVLARLHRQRGGHRPPVTNTASAATMSEAAIGLCTLVWSVSSIGRRANFLNDSNTRSRMWASICESFKQVVPWRRRQEKMREMAS
ncbi:hypothetical protein ACFX2B_012120 [Malus domestica]